MLFVDSGVANIHIPVVMSYFP